MESGNYEQNNIAQKENVAKLLQTLNESFAENLSIEKLILATQSLLDELKSGYDNDAASAHFNLNAVKSYKKIAVILPPQAAIRNEETIHSAASEQEQIVATSALTTEIVPPISIEEVFPNEENTVEEAPIDEPIEDNIVEESTPNEIISEEEEEISSEYLPILQTENEESIVEQETPTIEEENSVPMEADILPEAIVSEEENPIKENNVIQSIKPIEASTTVEAFNPWESTGIDEIPTMIAHTTNDKFANRYQTVADNKSATENLNSQFNRNTDANQPFTPIKDLRSAININERFLLTKELFGNNQTQFNEAIRTLDGFKSRAEAQFYFERELETKLGWDKRTPAYQQFLQLFHRRFM